MYIVKCPPWGWKRQKREKFSQKETGDLWMGYRNEEMAGGVVPLYLHPLIAIVSLKGDRRSMDGRLE